MTRERAKWMDQASLLTSGTAEATGKLCRPPMASSVSGRLLAFLPFQGASGECQFRSIATRSSRLVAIDCATPVGIGDHPGSVRQAGDGDGSSRFGVLSAVAAGRQAASRGGKRWAFTAFQLDGFATARTRIGRATGRLGRGHRYAEAKRGQRHQKRLHYSLVPRL